MALGKALYRKAFPDLRDELRRTGASLLARRCFDELTIGRHSSATGAFLLDPEYLRVDLGEHSKAKVIAALEELERLGWLSWCRQTRAAVLPQYAHRCPGGNPSHTQGLLAECLALPPSTQRDLAVEIITKVSTGSDKALATLCGESPHQKQKQNQEQKQEQNSKNNRVHPPAVADDTEFPEPDWAAIAATKAAAPLSVWDGKLPAQPAKQPEPEPQPDAQQALTLKPPAKRDLTPAQLDAIFAREQMALWVDEWNKIMAAHNVPATLSDHAKLATTLMRSVARLKNEVRASANPIELMRWVANTKHADYYAGKKGKKWTLKAWLAADNLGLAFTCYREYHDNHDARRQWYWHTDRTLTEWREAVQEERDRQAKYRQMMEAEAHDAAA